jgi:hypothetical protein
VEPWAYRPRGTQPATCSDQLDILEEPFVATIADVMRAYLADVNARATTPRGVRSLAGRLTRLRYPVSCADVRRIFRNALAARGRCSPAGDRWRNGDDG